MENLNAIRVFVHVAQTRSFKEAAARLGLTSSAVSKAITRLEAEMGVRLLQRTTRSVGLSNDGEIFFQRCWQILDELESAETMLHRAAAGPYGQLRIHMTVAFGSVVVMPAIGEFIERHPSLIVNAEVSDRHVDMAYEGFDVSLRIGEVADARLIARPLGQLRFVACASPDYLARHGEPATPADLDHHHCLAYTHIHSGRFREWHFKEDGKVVSKTVSGRLNVNNAQSLMQAATSGLGIVFVSHFVAAEALASGRLRPVLADFAAPGPRVSAVYLPSHHQSPKVRAFVDFLGELLERRPDWSDAIAGAAAGPVPVRLGTDP